jgi:hypothetical protein
MIDDNPLGLMRDYGNLIISVLLILWGILYTYLNKEYGSPDE